MLVGFSAPLPGSALTRSAANAIERMQLVCEGNGFFGFDDATVAGGQSLSEHFAPGGAEERGLETGRPGVAVPGCALHDDTRANTINFLPDHFCTT